MIDNKVRYEVDASGNYLDQDIGSVRALSDYSTVLELVSPFVLNTSVMVNFIVYDARNVNLPLFLVPINRKGYEVSNNPEVADFNVWQATIGQKALSAISKYRAGRIGVSFTFRERRPSKKALYYKGVFNDDWDLPIDNNQIGDYYVAGRYNISVEGVLYNYQDNAVWDGHKWDKDNNYRVVATTTTIDLPVDPAVLSNVPEVSDQDIADLIAEWGASFVGFNRHMNDMAIHHTEEEIIEIINDNIPDVSAQIEEHNVSPEAHNDLFDKKLDKVTGKGLSTNDYTTAEKYKLNGIEAGAQKNPYSKTQLDTMFGDKTNEADFLAYQTTVQNFLNGKLDKKPDGTVDLITALNKIDTRYLDIDSELFIIVASLPTTGVANKIYLVPKSDSGGSNIYDEYVWLTNKWEQFGTVTIDLSNYYNKTEINNLLSPKITKAQGDTYYVPLARTINSKALNTNITLNATDVGLGNVDNTSDLDKPISTATQTALNNKQNKLTAGENITIVDNVISSKGGGYIPYGVTTGTQTAYTLSIPSITELTVGLVVAVKFHSTNAANATININGLGAKNIKRSNVNVAIASITANSVFILTYDGTDFQYIDTNTTYNAMNTTNLEAGTSNTSMLISPKLIRDNFYLKSEVYNAVLDGGMADEAYVDNTFADLQNQLIDASITVSAEISRLDEEIGDIGTALDAILGV